MNLSEGSSSSSQAGKTCPENTTIVWLITWSHDSLVSDETQVRIKVHGALDRRIVFEERAP
jgi:hypothetical protein